METMSGWTPLIFAGEVMLVSLALGIVLLWLLHRCRCQLAQQQERIDLLAKRQASVFLDREIAHTRELSQRTPAADEPTQRLLHARIRWLQAEQRALVEEGGKTSDPALLKRAAHPLLALMTTEAPARGSTAPRRSDAALDEQLQRAKTVISLQKDIIGKLKSQLAQAAPTADGRHQVIASTLGEVSDNADRQSALVAKLESELVAADASHRRLSEELARLQTRHDAATASATGLLVVSRDKPTLSMESARELVGEMEHAHGESLIELKTMRETNARQRQLILQLEQELLTVRQDADEHSPSQALLENLKQQLRDHENCTATLEMETANLRVRIEALSRIIEATERSGTIDMVDHVNREAVDAAVAQAWGQRQRLGLQRLAEIAACDSVERACQQVTGWLVDLGLDFAACIKGAGQQYWLTSDTGGVDDRVRSVLVSAVRDPGSAWMGMKDGSAFVGSSLRLYVADRSAGAEELAALRDSLTVQLAILDSLLFHIDAKGQQPSQILLFKNIVQQTRKQITSIDKQHHYIIEEGLRVGSKLHEEMSRYFTTLNLTPIQRECAQSMLDDFKTEISLLIRASNGLRSNLRVAARGLNQINASGTA